jgi:CRP-like cAMP-binding protein
MPGKETAFIEFIKTSIPNSLASNNGMERIISSFEWLPLEKGEYLLKEGRISGYYVLLNGHMRAYTHNDAGDEVTTDFYTGPRVVFEAASFFLHQPSSVNIMALCDCEGFYTSFANLNQIFHEVPEFREFGRAILVKEFVTAQKQKLAFISQSAEQRYQQLVLHNQDLLQYAQLRHIASFLGITDTSLSRIRRDLSNR